MNIFDTKLQLYTGGIKSNKPIGTIKLSEFIARQSQPNDQLRRLLTKISEAKKANKNDLKTRLKEQLPFVVPTLIVGEYRRYECIESFNPFMQLDFDKIDNAIDFKAYLFEAYEEIICAYLSPSKMGVKALLRIPICKSVEEYKAYYGSVEDEFGMFDGFDSATKNAVLPLFFSSDPFMLVRENAKVWTTKADVENLPMHQAIPFPPRAYDSSKKNNWKREKTERIFINKIADINSGSGGHPNVRSAALVLGTRVGAGYITYFDAVSLAENCISRNAYLSKGTAGYIKTAIWGIERGMKTPNTY